VDSCVVCSKKTKGCVPAPHAPYSRWLCDECRQAKRINYNELIEAFSGTLVEDEQLGPYINKFKVPTLAYYSKTEEEFREDVRRHKSYVA